MVDSPLAAAARVDAQDREDSVGGAGKPFVRLVEPPVGETKPEAEAAAEADAAAALAEAMLEKGVVVRALARTVVSLAMEAGGQDPRCWRPLDVITAENIERQLVAVMLASKATLPAAFRFSSTVEEMRQAASVASALNEGDAR